MSFHLLFCNCLWPYFTFDGGKCGLAVKDAIRERKKLVLLCTSVNLSQNSMIIRMVVSFYQKRKNGSF